MKKLAKTFRKLFRIIFLIIFILFFVASSVAIIFYASGYKYNAKTGKVEKTGILMVDQNGDGLSFFVDGKVAKLIPKKSPANFFQTHYTLSMPPGEYDFEIRKSGYKPYQRRIKIEKELVTKIDDIVFVPEKITRNRIDIGEDVRGYKLSSNNKLILVESENNNLFLYNIENNNSKNLTENNKFAGKIESIEWNSNNTDALIKISNGETSSYQLINTQSGVFANINETLSFVPFFENLFFSSKTPGEFFGISQEKLYMLNINTKELSEVVSGISNYYKSEQSLYYFEKSTGNFIKLDLETLRKDTLLENYTPDLEYKIYITGGKDTYMVDHKNLFLIKNKNNLEIVERDVSSVVERSDKKSFFVIKGENELSLINPDKEKVLITRFGKKIFNIAEYADGKNMIYLSENSIGIVNMAGNTNQIIENKRYESLDLISGNSMLAKEGPSIYHFKIDDN